MKEENLSLLIWLLKCNEIGKNLNHVIIENAFFPASLFETYHVAYEAESVKNFELKLIHQV